MYLMEFLWGLTHVNFPNMCPYFWLSVMNVIISPLAIPLWFIVKSIRITRRTYVENKRIRLAEERQVRILKYKELLAQGIRFKELLLASKYELSDKQSKRAEKKSFNARTELLRDLDSDSLRIYYTRLNEMRLERRKKKEEAFRETAPERARKAMYQKVLRDRKQKAYRLKGKREHHRYIKKNKRKIRWNKRWAKWNRFWAPIKLSHIRKQQLIGKWTLRIKTFFKYFKYVIYAVLLVGVVYGGWWLTTFDYGWVVGVPWGLIWYWSWRVVVVIALIITIMTGIGRLSEYLKYNPIKLPWLKKILYIFYIFYPLVLLWKGLCWIGRGFKRLWHLLMALKKDNCPAIEWE